MVFSGNPPGKRQRYRRRRCARAQDSLPGLPLYFVQCKLWRREGHGFLKVENLAAFALEK
jgi:hypothetical protein